MKKAVTLYVVSSAFLLIVTFPGPAFPVFLFGPKIWSASRNNLLNNKIQVIRSWLARIFCKVNSFVQSK